MTTTERERRVAVSGQIKCRRHEPLQAVALAAEIEVGRRDKLACMHVRMTIVASLKLDFVDRSLALGNVALTAGQTGMLSLQGIRGRCMLLQSEGGGLKPIHRVAIRTLSPSDSLIKLASVWILMMAVGAFWASSAEVKARSTSS